MKISKNPKDWALFVALMAMIVTGDITKPEINWLAIVLISLLAILLWLRLKRIREE